MSSTLTNWTRLTTQLAVDAVLFDSDTEDVLKVFCLTEINCVPQAVIAPTLSSWPASYSNVRFYEIPVESDAINNEAVAMYGMIPNVRLFKNYGVQYDYVKSYYGTNTTNMENGIIANR
ncbi:hypothetical protein DFA_12336 [Cavenderia fasciculata]|uniref:Uncharacterized protein n=1 Tax=Cavenderia fasciculata TaxID=261658 RepID=F4QD89_CACFS|nr:uncharacterized protein DFA_12336 [Cavenderia fasciculata]EGG14560.1 hypothetical protein DFA_12336 [Cavenderia fasciculata]|eukprot:XP_004366080.1 hypothetical protein DFA_12336 [Cavenderia fasciculata]